MSNKVEIMAPAGSFESLQAAIQAGANSIYFGVGKLNMRARSANFSTDDLKQIVQRCKENGVRTYLTINTVVYDDELDELRSLCDIARDAGVSAIIATDMSVISYARTIDLEVHLSTQVNVSNIEAVKFFSRFADVIVLARELSINKIKNICDQIVIQDIRGPSGELVKIEVFVHGALCIAISGKCYMSLAEFDHSANRGACFQTCRRSYRVTDSETGQEFEIDNQYVMSPSDLCTLGKLEQIIEAGVSILKIEGRGRGADYVKATVEAYKNALSDIENDEYTNDKKECYIKSVEKVFNRGFWHGGYYLGLKANEWSNSHGSKSTYKKVFAGVVSNYFAKKGVGEFKLQVRGVEVGDTVMITGPTTGVLEFEIESIHLADGPARKSLKGDTVGIKVPAKVRRNDKIFVMEKR